MGLFWDPKSRDFYPRLFDKIPWDFFPWDWDFFSWDETSHKKATSVHRCVDSVNFTLARFPSLFTSLRFQGVRWGNLVLIKLRIISLAIGHWIRWKHIYVIWNLKDSEIICFLRFSILEKLLTQVNRNATIFGKYWFVALYTCRPGSQMIIFKLQLFILFKDNSQ